MRKIQSIAAVLLLAGAVSAQEADPAQKARPLPELLKDRAAVQEAIKTLTKSWDDARKEFADRKETKEFNAKLQKLQEGFQASDRRLKELDSQIAEQVSKEHKGK